jgi:hypothetical protein
MAVLISSTGNVDSIFALEMTCEYGESTDGVEVFSFVFFLFLSQLRTTGGNVLLHFHCSGAGNKRMDENGSKSAKNRD